MAFTLKSVTNLKVQWRQQVMRRRTPRWMEPRRGFVALAVLDQSPVQTPFVELCNVLVVVLYEDGSPYVDGSRGERTSLRFAGYRASRVSHGVRWGGPENSAFFKDLTLSPQRHGRGQRMDVRKVELLQLALELDLWLSLAARHPGLRRPALRLPRLWAGFRTRDVDGLCFDGPEFEGACVNQGLLATP